MSLSAHVTVPGRGVDVEFEVGDGETVALLGPNGAGKSTVLSALAGLLDEPAGRIELDGRVLADDATGARVPAHRRGVALLAQDALLFPHLDALDNVAFGPRSRGLRRRAARAAARDWLAWCGIADLADRRPHQLSGGQQQRVAIARALATEPRLLLLDEPMAALDVTVAPKLRRMLRDVLRGRSAVLVTHDLLDAVLLADRVIVLERGRVVQAGPAGEVFARPLSEFVADLAGVSVLWGTVRDGAVVTADGQVLHGLAGEELIAGEPAAALVSPTDVSVFRDAPAGSPRNVLPVEIETVEPQGAVVRVTGGGLAAAVTPAAVAELALAPGEQVVFIAKASAVTLYPLTR